MNRQTIIEILNGNSNLLMSWFYNRKSNIDYGLFLYWFQTNINTILDSWQINTVFNKEGETIKFY